MNRRFRLATVLRVRRVQEDLARVEVAKAQAELRAAEREHEAAERRVDTHVLPTREHVTGYVAAVVARRSLAGEAFAAARLADEAGGAVDARLADWQAASGRVSALENLEARHAEQVRHDDDRREQAATDEMGAFLTRRREVPRD